MLLLLIVPIWVLLLLMVAALCAGARIGDATEQVPDEYAAATRGTSPEQWPPRRRFTTGAPRSAGRERSLDRPAV
jgi:hypothetical protein